MRRALLELQKDQRVHDFCGENLRAGYWVSVTEAPTENYIKFGFTIKGSSGDLGASIIADYLTHRELTILEAERSDYFEQRTQIKGQMAKIARDKKKLSESETKLKELDNQYVPIDFDSYSIEDKKMILNKAATLEEDNRIWRISSLTAFVDGETKILLMPLPESKRPVKIRDTAYNFSTIGDLVQRRDEIEEKLSAAPEEKVVKRFEDKTADEIREDVQKKRQVQMGKMATTRKWQFGLLGGAAGFYFLVYRKFLHPKKIMHSALYNDSLVLVKGNKLVHETIGPSFQMMTCNGKLFPFLSNCSFDLVLFGTKSKGKVNVKAKYESSQKKWQIDTMNLVTTSGK